MDRVVISFSGQMFLIYTATILYAYFSANRVIAVGEDGTLKMVAENLQGTDTGGYIARWLCQRIGRGNNY